MCKGRVFRCMLSRLHKSVPSNLSEKCHICSYPYEEISGVLSNSTYLICYCVIYLFLFVSEPASKAAKTAASGEIDKTIDKMDCIVRFYIMIDISVINRS